MILNYFPERVLLVGATGFTGERVARRLCRSGVTVHALTRHPEGETARQLAAEGCTIFEGDCDRLWTLWQALEGCEVIVSCSHIRYAQRLVQACHRMRVRRIVAMSSTRRFSRVADPTVDEVINGEMALSHGDLEYTVIRPSMIYGSRRDRNISRLMRWFDKWSWIPVFGDGKALVQPVFVEDVVGAILDTLRRPHTVKKSYTLAGPEPMTWDEMVRAILEARGQSARVFHVPLQWGFVVQKVLGSYARSRGLTREMLERVQESKAFETEEARVDLDFRPIPFLEVVRGMVTGDNEVEAMYPARQPAAPDS